MTTALNTLWTTRANPVSRGEGMMSVYPTPRRHRGRADIKTPGFRARGRRWTTLCGPSRILATGGSQQMRRPRAVSPDRELQADETRTSQKLGHGSHRI